MDEWAMTMVLVAIGLGLVCVLFAVSACIQSGDIAEHERRIEALKALGWAEFQASANCDYAASDDADGNEAGDAD